jgi:hypothetical protein
VPLARLPLFPKPERTIAHEKERLAQRAMIETHHPTIGRPTLDLLSGSVVAVPLEPGVGVAGRLISACKAMFSLTATYSLSAYPSKAEMWLLLRPLMRFTSLVE